jgi:non-specific serine/threonine protein kinase
MSHLPAFPPPLVGRDAEVRELLARFGQTRLLTLVGPGGCGKTRLALQLAGELRATFADAIWLVDLAPLQEPALLPDLARQAVGVAEDVSESAMASLVAALRDREFLLILDNCEHLIHASARFVEDLLHTCPRGRVLATSREALKSAYEMIWPTPPLALPEPGSQAPTQLLSYGAISLFVARARAAMPAFALTTDNATLVTEVCQRLDGLPLAIELAAGCLKMLTLSQLATALEEDFQVLVAGHRTAPPRQQTLQATIEWSYHLLTRDEQTLLQRLCVIAGDFNLSLVEALAAGACVAPATLLRLIEKSMAQVALEDAQSVKEAGEAGEVVVAEARYRLLETVKQYGRERLVRTRARTRTGDEAGVLESAESAEAPSAEKDGAMQRYCQWCATLVGACPADGSSGFGPWLDRVERELDHLRACLGWLYGRGKSEQVLRLATALVGFWRLRGHIGEGGRWLETGLTQGRSASVDSIAPGVRAEALNALGVLRMWQGSYREAQALHEEALAIWRALGDTRGEAMTRFRLGFLADKQNAGDLARGHLLDSLRLFRRLGDRWGVDLARNRLGVVFLNQGDYARAKRHLMNSLARLRACQHTGGVATTLLNLGALLLAQGDSRQATAALRESLALHERLHDHLATAYAHLYLGYAAYQDQAPAEAERQFRFCLGLVTSETSESSPELIVRLFDGLAAIASKQGRALHAARLWGAMAALRERYGVRYRTAWERQGYEGAVAAARTRLGIRAFDAAWVEGSQRSLSDILAGEAAPTLTAPRSVAQDQWRPQARVRPFLAGRPGARQKPEVEGYLPALRITSLGHVGIYRGERLATAAELPYAKARELLFYLLSYPTRSKEQIGLALWPDATPAHLRSSFRVILYHLRRALGDPTWIVRDGQRYRFNRVHTSTYWYDVEAFDAAIASAQRQVDSAPDHARALLEAALALYHGDFLEELPAAEWIMQWQERLRQQRLQALLLLGQLYLARQEARLARDTFLSAVASDPYSEEAHRGVISSYVQAQEHSQAARHYARMRETFARELGIAPAPATLAALSALDSRSSDLTTDLTSAVTRRPPKIEGGAR